MERYDYYSIHAEFMALCSRTSFPKNSSIIVARFNHMGDPLMSRPCEKCCKLLRDHGLTKIYYTTPQGVQQERL